MSEITKPNFKSEIIANAAKVIPIEKDPVLPTKILPAKFKAARTSQTTSGPSNRIAFDPEMDISPIMTTAGHTVSKPFNPPSWFTVLENTVTSNGIIRK